MREETLIEIYLNWKPSFTIAIILDIVAFKVKIKEVIDSSLNGYVPYYLKCSFF